MKWRIVTLFLPLFWSAVVLGQFEDGWDCGMTEDQQATAMKSSSGSYLPTFIEPLPTFDGINFKVAVLYFKDADDTFDAGGDCRVNSWPITSNGRNNERDILASLSCDPACFWAGRA